ncbi:hypothetical protein BSQ39_07130 [Loigolactobacillus backii]|nr:hypothetical protein AYR52_03725 [Loigolactobacillus backii]ANK64422.1 hypothetical protein AYR54_03735 [Loigolactobacillus backii]ANK67182.1 hypothetical protein AYR55_05300 [Loigolactobacillus backii]OLF70753.1 hypothetical protein ACX53_00025 [Loigolactobacillus backii]PIO83342.1 hypothetical protein BSQ39_07130 [Loigolactobacillus backii]
MKIITTSLTMSIGLGWTKVGIATKNVNQLAVSYIAHATMAQFAKLKLDKHKPRQPQTDF